MAEMIHTIYVDPKGKDWQVTGENPRQQFGIFESKESAIHNARELAKRFHGQMVVRSNLEQLEFAEDYASVER